MDCAKPVAGYPAEESKPLLSIPKVPPAIAVFANPRGVAPLRPSGMIEARVRGFTYVLIGVVNEKNTNTRPARAGFAQFAPRPPKVHFATKMANALAKNGMNKGTEGLMFIPTKRPVK